MRTILAIAMITCFFAVQTSALIDCIRRLAALGHCIGLVALYTDNEDGASVTEFCSECSNSLISYARECDSSPYEVDDVKAGDLWSKSLIMISCYILLHARNHAALLYIAGMN